MERIDEVGFAGVVERDYLFRRLGIKAYVRLKAWGIFAPSPSSKKLFFYCITICSG